MQLSDSKQDIESLIKSIGNNQDMRFSIIGSCFNAGGRVEKGRIVEMTMKGSRAAIREFYESNQDLFELEDYPGQDMKFREYIRTLSDEEQDDFFTAILDASDSFFLKTI